MILHQAVPKDFLHQGSWKCRKIVDDSLPVDHVDDASDFLKWKELPQGICDRMKACWDKLTAQTSSSLTRFRNDLTVTPSNGKQKEWSFILLPLTSKKICISGSGFKLTLHQCSKEQQKKPNPLFPSMAGHQTQVPHPGVTRLTDAAHGNKS